MRFWTLVWGLALCLTFGACAVKGYDLGWRSEDGLTRFLGAPQDGLSGCRAGRGQTSTGCDGVDRDIAEALATLPPTVEAPTALGFRCRGARCTYANAWDRRDVGAATVFPVYRRVVLREVRIAAVRQEGGVWQLDTLVIRDAPGPAYGPVTLGGVPADAR